jgi:hypothetical protein
MRKVYLDVGKCLQKVCQLGGLSHRQVPDLGEREHHVDWTSMLAC